MYAEIAEIRSSENPDRIIMLIPGLNPNRARNISLAAVRIARQTMPKMTGDSARRLQPLYGKGFFGIYFPDSYVFFQDHGVRPFTMTKIAGKAQPLDEFVLTPIGWQKMGYIVPGSMVIGSNGQPTEVLDVFPQGVLDCYRVTFTDGTSVRCSEDHLWTVRRSGGGLGRWETRSTCYLAARPKTRWMIPLVSPVHLEELNLPLDPYAVGVFLGDGCLTGSSPSFSASDSAVPDEMRIVLPGFEVRKAKGANYTWTVTSGARGTRHNPISEALRRIGIKGLYSYEKFIPAIYMAGAPSMRESLLQGLMDSDGTASLAGHLRYSTCSPMLAENVADLVRGLGGHASVTSSASRNGYRPMYSVAFRLPSGIDPFRANLERRRRYVGKVTKHQGKRVVSIEREGVSEMQCLLVAAEDSLYVTSGYTLTHNTIPMWLDDPSGDLRQKNPKAKTRTTASGKNQVLIFRRAAKIGQRIDKYRTDPKTGIKRLVGTTVASYPGAPGRISARQIGGSGSGKVGGSIAPGNGGVRWRHPGLSPRLFLNHAMSLAAQQNAILPVRVYLADRAFRVEERVS
jgi:hypothetical protein